MPLLLLTLSSSNNNNPRRHKNSSWAPGRSPPSRERYSLSGGNKCGGSGCGLKKNNSRSRNKGSHRSVYHGGRGKSVGSGSDNPMGDNYCCCCCCWNKKPQQQQQQLQPPAGIKLRRVGQRGRMTVVQARQVPRMAAASPSPTISRDTEGAIIRAVVASVAAVAGIKKTPTATTDAPISRNRRVGRRDDPQKLLEQG